MTAPEDQTATTLLVDPGRNCWRIARAGRATVVVDAADYYHFVREAMEQAERRILLIGWDFDVRIPLEPDARGQGESLGRFMLRLAKAKPDRDIAILKWSFGALKQWLRPSAAIMLLRWAATKSIRYRFDSAHPPGCSHHQKIVVIDDCFAVCGGIDMSTARWDTSEHRDGEPRRKLVNGSAYPPWHDVTMLVDEDAAVALSDLSRDRWLYATGETIDPLPPSECHWPDDIEPLFRNVDIAIARTRAAYEEHEEIREVEALWLDMIAAARRFIYIENQYLTNGKVAAAIAERMAEADPPEVVVVMPRSADGWLEQRAMDGARVRLARAIGKVDCLNRFRIYVPVTPGGADIYVHAKVAIVDDQILRVGSANLNNRSFGLDSECDLVIDCALPANSGCEAQIRALRERLMAEHLDASTDEVAAEFDRTGSLIAVIDALNHKGRHLDLLDLEKPGDLDKFIADNELLDPENADGFLEPLHKRSLWKSWRKGRKKLRDRLRWRGRKAR